METYSLDELQTLLPEFIAHEYPKWNENRGRAVVAITLFTIWLRNVVELGGEKDKSSQGLEAQKEA